MNKYKLLILIVIMVNGAAVFGQAIEKQDNVTVLEKFQKNCWRQDDKWFAADKMKHFTTSMFIFLTDYYYQHTYTDFSNDAVMKNAYTLSLTFGIGKEILDVTGSKSYFSIKDLIADFAGNVAGHIIINSIK